MTGLVTSAYRWLADTHPFVRPTYNQFEVALLPPYGDPEVHVPSEVGMYFLTGLVVTALINFLQDDGYGR